MKTNPRTGSYANTCRRHDSGRRGLLGCACNLYLVHVTLVSWMTKIAHLLFFPGRNLINAMATASVSSHGGLVAHVTPHTSREFRCSFPVYQYYSLMRKKSWAYKTSGTSAGAVQVGVLSHRGSLGPQRPCWGSSVLSAYLRRSRLGEWRVCACFPAACPTCMQERNAFVSLSHQQAARCAWLCSADMQDVSPTHGRSTAGLCMPRSITSKSAQGKRTMLELLMWHSCRLTGNILVLGSVPPMAARNSIASAQVSHRRVQCYQLLTVSYTHHSAGGVTRFKCLLPSYSHPSPHRTAGKLQTALERHHQGETQPDHQMSLI